MKQILLKNCSNCGTNEQEVEFYKVWRGFMGPGQVGDGVGKFS